MDKNRLPADVSAQSFDQDQSEFDDGVNQFFNMLFAKADRGEIPLSTIRSFFPSHIHEDCLDALDNFFPMSSD